MTGFGRGEHATTALIARVELTSINRKQAEVLVQMPRIYSELEAEIRKLALEKISRGRLTINIQLEPATEAESELQIDTAKVIALQAEIQRLNELPDQNLDLKLTSNDILRLPNVLTTTDNNADIDTAKTAILPALTAGLESLMTMRASEGSHLKKDTLDRLSILENEAKLIETHAPRVLQRYRENLHKRLAESGLELDLTDERLLKEMGFTFYERGKHCGVKPIAAEGDTKIRKAHRFATLGIEAEHAAFLERVEPVIEDQQKEDRVAGEKEKQGDAERALHAEGKGASERNSQNADNEIYVNNGSNTDLNRDFSSQQDPNVDPSTEDAFLREMEERRAKHEERARTREQSKKPKRRSR